MSACLTLENVSVARGHTVLVEPVSAHINRGEIIGVIGPNGAGKSSLLKALAGVLPYSGRVAWQGVELHTVAASARARVLAYMEQCPSVAWPLSVYETVALGRSFNRRLDKEDVAIIARALALTDSESRAQRRVDTLSGGEFARVMLARALATDAPLLLLDEPMSGLDVRYQAAMSACLKTVAATGKTILVSIHDINQAATLCSRALLLAGAKPLGFAPVEDLFSTGALAEAFGIPLHRMEQDGKTLIY